MNPKTLEHWKQRGWDLDPSLLDAPGEIINTGNGPYYIGEAKEIGYTGHAHPLIASRYAMGTKLGRPLTRNELVRFKSANKKDLRLSNLILHSKQASAAELYKANGAPILGYSHCLCKCGTELDLDKQKEQPYAFAEGHSPREKEVSKKKRARKPLQKVLQESLAKVGQPLLVIKKEQPMSDDPMKEFRMLFEKMIHNLPWDEFKELLHLLLEIQTRQEKKK